MQTVYRAVWRGPSPDDGHNMILRDTALFSDMHAAMMHGMSKYEGYNKGAFGEGSVSVDSIRVYQSQEEFNP